MRRQLVVAGILRRGLLGRQRDVVGIGIIAVRRVAGLGMIGLVVRLGLVAGGDGRAIGLIEIDRDPRRLERGIVEGRIVGVGTVFLGHEFAAVVFSVLVALDAGVHLGGIVRFVSGASLGIDARFVRPTAVLRCGRIAVGVVGALIGRAIAGPFGVDLGIGFAFSRVPRRFRQDRGFRCLRVRFGRVTPVDPVGLAGAHFRGRAPLPRP